MKFEDVGKSDQAETLWREALNGYRTTLGPEHSTTLGIMSRLALNLSNQKKFSESESIMRECILIHEKRQPDEWPSFNTKAQLGVILMAQKKYAEAEPLLLSGLEGMRKRAATLPPPVKAHLAKGLEKLAQLYDEWGKPEQASRWRKELASRQAAAANPVKLKPQSGPVPERERQPAQAGTSKAQGAGGSN
jgi:hypothetical protein